MTPAASRLATAVDAESIARLVNAAYRPASGANGWTHESKLVSGPRIDAADVAAALAEAGCAILIDRSATGIGACVQIQRRGEICLLGLLAVDPRRQGSGSGKRMLDEAERHAAEIWSCSTSRISVLSQRPELLSFYGRRGYRPIGSVSPYPLGQGVGSPIVDGLTITTLEKPLARAPTKN